MAITFADMDNVAITFSGTEGYIELLIITIMSNRWILIEWDAKNLRMSAVTPRDTMPPQKRLKKGDRNNIKIFQPPIDKRPKGQAKWSSSRRARKWCMKVHHHNNQSTFKSMGSLEKAETLLSRFKAKFPDNTPRIGKEDAEMWVKTRFVSAS